MHIVFWSNVHGQCGVTSNLAAMALELTLNYRYKVLMLHNEFNNPSLDEIFLEQSTLENVNDNMFDIGIDALMRYCKYNALNQENFKNYTTTILKNKLDLLQGTAMTNRESFYLELEQMEDHILNKALEYYDFVFSDATAGDSYSHALLERADVIVVNLSQNKQVIRDFFDHDVYKTYQDKCFFLLGKYDALSKYNRKNLVRQFDFNEKSNIKKLLGKSEHLGVIPYDTRYLDAMNDGKVADFFLLGVNKMKKEGKEGFFNRVQSSVEMLLRQLEINIDLASIGDRRV
jgi:hypothetical protein